MNAEIPKYEFLNIRKAEAEFTTELFINNILEHEYTPYNNNHFE